MSQEQCEWKVPQLGIPIGVAFGSTNPADLESLLRRLGMENLQASGILRIVNLESSITIPGRQVDLAVVEAKRVAEFVNLMRGCRVEPIHAQEVQRLIDEKRRREKRFSLIHPRSGISIILWGWEGPSYRIF